MRIPAQCRDAWAVSPTHRGPDGERPAPGLLPSTFLASPRDTKRQRVPSFARRDPLRSAPPREQELYVGRVTGELGDSSVIVLPRARICPPGDLAGEALAAHSGDDLTGPPQPKGPMKASDPRIGAEP